MSIPKLNEPVFPAREEGIMQLQPGQTVTTSDEVTIGHVVEIETNAEGTPTGIIVELNDQGRHESRLPVAWITGITESAVQLIVASSEIIRPKPLTLFDDQSGNVFWRDPFAK